MTAQAFNPCTCSAQDWAARLATVDACLMTYGMAADAKAAAAERFAENLHVAMGWRAEHLAELEF